jgi:hypothetical protein
MNLRPLILLALPLVLSHCTPIDDGGMTSGSTATGLPPGHQPYKGPYRGTYDLGMQQGKADGASDKSRQPSRHYGTFPATQTDAFNRGYQAGYTLAKQTGTGPVAGGALTPVKGVGNVALRRNGQTVAVCQTAMPKVETMRFIDGQRKIVVKSRGNHGPATVQLFNCATGLEEARVMAYEILNGQPAWASGMGE